MQIFCNLHSQSFEISSTHSYISLAQDPIVKYANFFLLFAIEMTLLSVFDEKKALGHLELIPLFSVEA